jgi:lysozyme
MKRLLLGGLVTCAALTVYTSENPGTEPTVTQPIAQQMTVRNDEDEFDGIAFDLIARWEGKRNHAYQDLVGKWTICYGHTRTAAPGQYKTDAECRALLVEEIASYRAGLHSYFTPETKQTRLPPTRDAAYTSLAYNIGVYRAGNSTATRRLNDGNIVGGCHALTWWNKAGGRVIRGLVRRRAEEFDLCMEGVS